MLKQRVLTAIVLLLVFAVVLFLLPALFFSLFVAVIAGAGAWEWSRLCQVDEAPGQIAFATGVTVLSLILLLSAVNPFMERWLALLALVYWVAVFLMLVTKPHRVLVKGTVDSTGLLCGAFVLATTAVAMQALHQGLPAVSALVLAETAATSAVGASGGLSEGSIGLLLYSLAIVWSMDIGAYFSGKRFGKNKLAPAISPGKTREGVYGGLLCALLLMLLALSLVAAFRDNAGRFFVATLLAALASVVGDLFESRLKRAVNFKDSSQLLPGHGGVLDRIDGVIAALPVFLCIWIWS